MARLRIGTCHWKYPSWVDLVYSQAKGINYLEEYARTYNTVEIDQWFWSLFKENRAVLPDRNTAREYAQSVPQDFIFTIKVPNSITLTHYYKKSKPDPLIRNPYFLSADLFNRFLTSIEPLHGRLGPLMLQFEYLNKLKMENLSVFLVLLEDFFKQIPKNFIYGIEIRNPNYLQPAYFEFLQKHNIRCVFLQGYFMPDIIPIYNKFKDYIKDCTVIRLHGPHRGDIEKLAHNRWDKILIARDQELTAIVNMVRHMLSRGIDVFLNVNNHYEGSSPLTIERIQKLLLGTAA
ncbi:MAG: DUF72 domain-containing protein [Spirochaetales bacterium]|nr:DUF72 domain-containing protein [Spirochaetales bacterium]